MYSRVNSNLLEDRLDAEFYSLEQIKNHKILQDYGVIPLSAYCNGINVGYTGELTSVYRAQGTTLFRVSDIDGIFLSNDDVNYVPDDFAANNPQIWIRDNDIVFAAVGNTIGKVALKTVSMPDGVCSRALMIARPLTDKIDSSFLIAYLATKYAQKSLLRGVSGSAQPVLNTPLIANLPVISAESVSQKYIGDKIRQAERLRAWAKRLERSLDAFIEHFQPEKKEYKKLFSRVPNNLLTNMLTATTYRERYISNQKNLKAISRIQPISYYLSSITNGYDERNEIDNGLPYVKVANVRAGYIDLKNTPRVRLSALTDASAKQKPEKGDLLLTRKGSFGIAAVVMESASFLCSSEVFSCKPSKPEFMPILSWFLNSEAGNMQFWQFSTGTTMPGINQENLQNILIPDFSTCDIEQFNSIHKNRYEAKKNAELLTDTAKTLVEALIEGQLTEQQLIQAQQALEDGDNSLDQAILSKLSAEGYAIEGATPLFSDVDELYRLLEEAAQAEAEE
ncbi:TPA: restriction endonuclease subunit S [Escherichia coli]|nr:restriction endonuclease subunit S [Escherichia coli]